MSQGDLLQLENYLFAKDKEEFLKKLIVGTDSHFFFTLMTRMNASDGRPLSKQDQEIFSNYMAKFNTQRKRSIEIRNLLNLYENEQNQNDQKSLMLQINQCLQSFIWNHTQPNNITAQNLSVEENAFSKREKLNEGLVSRENILEGALSSEYSLGHIDARLLSLLKAKTVASQDEGTMRKFLMMVDESLASMGDVPQLIKAYRTKAKSRMLGFEVEPVIFSKLSIEQIKELIKIEPDLSQSYHLIAQWFTKEFQIDSRDTAVKDLVPTAEKKDRKKLIKEMMKWTQNLHEKFNSFYHQLHYELVLLGYETNQYDFEGFFEYLKNPAFKPTGFNRLNQEQFATRNVDNFWMAVHNCQIFRVADPVITNTYIEELFNHSIAKDEALPEKDRHFLNDALAQLRNFFDENVTQEILYKTKLYRGEKIQFISEIFNSDTLKQINEEKTLTIAKDNQEYFVHGQEVSLQLQIKNVPELLIKIFQFCPENYYVKTKQELDSNIILDGLIAVEEQVHAFNHAPVIIFKHKFSFPRITETQQGIFIIEFIGSGVCSRAVIKKGRLSILTNITVAGHVFRMIDENLSICNGKRTGIWIDDKFYAVNSKTGEIIVPFFNSEGEKPAILVHDNFSSLGKVRLVRETYQFTCSYLFNSESMLTANVASILIHPRLGLTNGTPMPLSLLKDPVVTVTAVNDVGIPSTTTFDKLILDYKEEVTVQVPIVAQITTLNIKVTAQIKYMTESETKKELKHEYTISFDQQLGNMSFTQQVLRYTDVGYEIYVVGKNGEPKPDVKLQVGLYIDGLTTRRDDTLHTDQEGRVFLGQLKHVKSISSSIQQKGDILTESRLWYIANMTEVNYPSYIKMLDDQEVRLPFSEKELNLNTVNFVRMSQISSGSYQSGFIIHGKQVSVISNELHRLKVQGSRLILRNLPKGQYSLFFKNQNAKIEIDVIKGYKLKLDNTLIVTDNSILDLKRTSNFLLTEVLQFEKSKEEQEKEASQKQQPSGGDKYNLVLQVHSDQPEQTRVHLVAFNYLQTNINDLASTIINQTIIEQPTLIPVFNSRSVYMSNKTLGDEYRYVLDRKKQPVYVGNTLDKPQVLLKRKFRQETTLDGEVVGEGSAFRDAAPVVSDLLLQNQIRAAEQSSYGRAVQIMSVQLNRVESFLNFLESPSIFLSNLKPDKDGIVELKGLNLGAYSTLQIITTNLYSTTTTMFPLPKRESKFRDMTQKSNFKKDKFYSIFRSNGQIIEGEKLVIEDLTSTEYQLVDSIPQLFTIQKELRKCFGDDQQQTSGYDFWDFLKTWDSLELKEKHQKYDKYSCHELNVFIYCQDQAYYNNHVRPFLFNQIEQTFVDYFLLRDDTKLFEYTSPAQIAELNPLELILLIIFLQDNDQSETAREIANFIDLKNQLITYDTQQFQKLFDTVLNAKTEESKEQLGDLLDPFSNQINMNMNMNMQMQMPMPMNMNMNMNMNNNNVHRMNRDRVVQPQIRQVQQQMYSNIAPSMPNANAYLPPPGANPFGGMAPPPPTMGGDMGGFGMYAAPPPMYQQPQQQQQQQQYQNYGNLDIMNDELLEDLDSNSYDPYNAPQPSHLSARQGYVSQFKNSEQTKEYCERQYYNQKEPSESKNLIVFSQFWVDLARHLTETVTQPFMSHNFMYLARNHTEMIAVLSFMSLPFKSTPHKYNKTEGKGFQMIVSGNSVTFIQEIKEGKSQLRSEILVSQRFFEPKDRYIYRDDDPSIKEEKGVKQYIVDRVYGCEVVVTNCSVSQYQFQVLVEVPEGSIPVHVNDYTKSHQMILESFNTKTLNFYFYFPQPGQFSLYPANVASFGTVVAVAKEFLFEVNLERTISTMETMEEILTQGSQQDILDFVRTQNILNENIFRFHEIYYLLQDKEFYLKLVEILRARQVYDQGVWSYSIYNNDHISFVQYLNSQSTISLLGSQMNYFQNSLVHVQPLRVFQYYPLINARVHMLHQDKCNILNKQFRNQYQRFIEVLVEQGNYNLADQLTLIYYLLIQDRIEQSIKVYSIISEDEIKGDVEGRLQYDYCTAYLDFYTGYPNFKKAREISEKYLDFPVISWRNKFYDIANRLAEYDGEDKEQSKMTDQNSTSKKALNSNAKKNEKGAELEETLTIKLEGTKIILTHQNLSQVDISFYLIDLEVLFSRNPFLSQDSEDFSFVIPNQQINKELQQEDGLTKTELDMPQQFEKANVFIQVLGKSLRVAATYFSNSMTLQIVENFGQIKVFDQEDKPQSKVYVKTFYKDKSGRVLFYQDGYTDLIGRFDYVSNTTCQIQNIDQFAIFVYSQELGSLIKEAKPPSSLAQIETQIELIGGKHKEQATQKLEAQLNTYQAAHAKQCRKAWN